MKSSTIVKLSIIAVVLAAISFWSGQQSYSWFPPQASLEAKLIDGLFSFLVSLGTFIFLGVLGTLSYSVLFQRAAKYDYSDGPAIEGNNTLEIIWTVIPFILVVWIAFYSYQVYSQMSIQGSKDHSNSEAVEVYSRQWAWEFRYPKNNVVSSELHLPVNQRAFLKLQSEDVIHGFYVPAFRVKQDIIPGKTIDFEFTPILEGKYRLRDSQYSGTYFAAMQSNVIVESPEEYQRWLASSAKAKRTPSYNQAYQEFNNKKSKLRGWRSIKPAEPPLVNNLSPGE
jgi:cytochrome c oxidase subunit II